MMLLIAIISMGCHRNVISYRDSYPISVYAYEPVSYMYRNYIIFNHTSDNFLLTHTLTGGAEYVSYSSGIWNVKADSVILNPLVDFKIQNNRKSSIKLFPCDEYDVNDDPGYIDCKHKYIMRNDTIIDVTHKFSYFPPSHFPALLVFGKPVIESTSNDLNNVSKSQEHASNKKEWFNKYVLTVYIDESNNQQTRYLLFDHLENNYLSVCSGNNEKSTEYIGGIWLINGNNITVVPEFRLKINDSENIIIDSVYVADTPDNEYKYLMKGKKLIDVTFPQSDKSAIVQYKYVHGESLKTIRRLKRR